MNIRLSILISLVVLALTSLLTASGAQHSEMRTGPSPATVTFPEGKDVVEIPFEFVRDKILIAVRVNGSEPMSFVLDTGAPIAVFMDSELASTLNLNIVGQALVGGVGEGEASTVPIAGDVMFEFGGIEITGGTMAIGVAEGKLPDLGWHGVIGRPVFTNLVADFDFANRILRLYPPEKFTYIGDGTELPLTIAYGSFPYVDTEVSIDGGAAVPATLVIDTGAGHALSLSVENHDDLDLPEKTVAGVLGWGANGAIRGHKGRVTSLKLGDYVLHDVVTGFPDPSGMQMLGASSASNQVERHGILGAKVLKRFRVIFDYTNTRLILEPNTAFESPFTFNTTGLMPSPWTPGATFIEVADVIASSPAEAAGIEVGDRVTAIDGKPVAGISVDEINELLEQAPGSEITLTIRREAEEFEAKLVLRELI
jgi:predicted aspartyl protease